MRELVNRYLEYLTYEKRYSTHTILNYKKDLEEWQSFCKQELIERSPCVFKLLLHASIESKYSES